MLLEKTTNNIKIIILIYEALNIIMIDYNNIVKCLKESIKLKKYIYRLLNSIKIITEKPSSQWGLYIYMLQS